MRMAGMADIARITCEYALDKALWAQQRGDVQDAARRVLAALPILKELIAVSAREQPDGHQHNNLAAAVAELAYMLALELCQAGGSAPQRLADALLRQLGCRYRLALAVFAAPPPQLGHCELTPAAPRVFDDVLPGPLLLALQHGFARDSPFWQEHQYFDPATPFFSYFYDLAAEPQSAVEAAARLLARALVASLSQHLWQGVDTVEWWAHTRAAGEPHQLHFDLDETRLRRGRQHFERRHPVCSSILYLSDAGGPTVVLNQEPGDGLAPEAWLMRPQPGRLAAFRGSLLHGVLPGNKDQPGSRTTLVLAFWAGGRQPAAGPPGSGPARHPPWHQPTPSMQQQPEQLIAPEREAALQRGQLTWPAALAWQNGARESADAAGTLPLAPSADSPQHAAPAWVPVLDSESADDSASFDAAAAAHGRKQARRSEQRLSLPPLRFFVTSETEIREVYGA